MSRIGHEHLARLQSFTTKSSALLHGGNKSTPLTPHTIALYQSIDPLRRPKHSLTSLARRLAFGHWIVAIYVRSLPAHRITLTATEPGRSIQRHLRERIFGWPTAAAAAVLELPQSGELYLRGRKRQALRTNLTKANALRLTCRRVSTDALIAAAVRQRENRGNIHYLDILLAENATAIMEHWLAFDPDNQPIGFARLIVDANVAWLKFMTCIRDDEHSVVRYALSAAIFCDLADRGVRDVITTSALRIYPGLVYFQERLGFRFVRVEL